MNTKHSHRIDKTISKIISNYYETDMTFTKSRKS
jgi:hypothetical protein